MKILHILDSLNRGGAETMLLDVCRNAPAHGLDMIFAATGGGDLEDQFRESGVEFVRLQRKLPVDLSLAMELRNLITERKIDVVHTHQPVEALHAYLATRGLEVRRVLSVHGVYADTKNRLALKFVMPRLHARVAVSRNMLTLTREQGFNTENGFLVINNGVDPRRLVAAPTLRKELGVNEEAVLLGMIANFYADGRKDPLTVCKALPALLKAAPQARFVFAGSASTGAQHLFDECVDYCRAQKISDRVHFLGRRDDIPSVLNSLDVFVLSSVWEGAPIAGIEAMMAGVAPVFSDIPALREVSDDGRKAVLFRRGDAGDLASKLIPLVENRETRKDFESRARDWARREFGIEKHISALSALYQSLVTVDPA